MPKQTAEIEYVLIEVIVDKFGNPQSKGYWKKLESEIQAERISAKAYSAAIKKGIPYRVNVYGPAIEEEEEEE